MKTIFLIAWLASCPVCAQTINDYMVFTAKWEGLKTAVYSDSRGNLTIGFGHKLSKYEHFKKISVSKAQSLFVADTCEALASAKACVSTFNDQPPTVKLILVDMAYTLGKNGLSKFKRMITACNNGNYIKMSDELRDSHYYHQCKNRGKHHADKLLGIGKI